MQRPAVLFGLALLVIATGCSPVARTPVLAPMQGPGRKVDYISTEIAPPSCALVDPSCDDNGCIRGINKAFELDAAALRQAYGIEPRRGIRGYELHIVTGVNRTVTTDITVFAPTDAGSGIGTMLFLHGTSGLAPECNEIHKREQEPEARAVGYAAQLGTLHERARAIIVPEYPAFGSPLVEAYGVREIADALARDAMVAGRRFLVECADTPLTPQAVVGGFSQGGHAALSFHEAISRGSVSLPSGIELKAVIGFAPGWVGFNQSFLGTNPNHFFHMQVLHAWSTYFGFDTQRAPIFRDSFDIEAMRSTCEYDLMQRVLMTPALQDPRQIYSDALITAFERNLGGASESSPYNEAVEWYARHAIGTERYPASVPLHVFQGTKDALCTTNDRISSTLPLTSYTRICQGDHMDAVPIPLPVEVAPLPERPAYLAHVDDLVDYYLYRNDGAPPTYTSADPNTCPCTPEGMQMGPMGPMGPSSPMGPMGPSSPMGSYDPYDPYAPYDPYDPYGPMQGPPSGPGSTPSNGCGDIDYYGRCEGDVAVWCAGGSLRRVDCRQYGQRCDWLDYESGFYCS